MLDQKICDLRDKLNNSILNNEDYDRIYQLSVDLDELIYEFYKKEVKV